MFPFQTFGGSLGLVVPGSTTYLVGNNQVVVPAYNVFSLILAGAGGGSGGQLNQPGVAGGASSWDAGQGDAVVAAGGGGGAAPTATVSGSPGANGGGSGPASVNVTTGGGGLGADGGNGNNNGTTVYGGAGGNGGLVRMTWRVTDPGAPVPGVIVNVVIGAGGTSGYGSYYTGPTGGAGSGSATWT